MDREEFKEKFGIIGNSKEINDIVDVIMQVGRFGYLYFYLW